LFNWLKKSAPPARVLGMDVSEHGYGLVVVDRSDTARPVVTDARWCAFAADQDRNSVLKQAIRDLKARGLPVVATLPSSAYSLVQIEAPDLDADELREAMRWRVKDLIDFPVEDATIDVFALPESRRPGAPSLVYVVVAKSDRVEALGGLLRDVGLEVEAIDIAEMAIRNLALHLDRPGRPRAYLQLQAGQTIIEISDGSQIFLSRRVIQDYDENSDAELLRAQMENLALEVQRSLDYFESQYALGPADRLSVIVDSDALFEAFGRVAGTFLTVQAERFSLTGIATSGNVDLDRLGQGATAVGAAMRESPRAA
jgi:MSHA biogenesis protein MshI